MYFLTIDWNPIVALISLVATGYITIRFSQSQNRLAAMDEKANRPYLNFGQLGKKWKLFNLGATPALQLRFGEFGFDDHTKLHAYHYKAFISYGLPAQSSLILTDEETRVIVGAHVLVANYFDVNDQEFIVYCRADTNHLFQRIDGLWEGRWKDISQEELSKIYCHLHSDPVRTGRLDYAKIFKE
jgi:hypothetical protein